MENSKMPTYLLVVIGLVLLIASLSADATGIGTNTGFGPRQTMGTIAGAVILAAGLFYLRKK